MRNVVGTGRNGHVDPSIRLGSVGQVNDMFPASTHSFSNGRNTHLRASVGNFRSLHSMTAGVSRVSVVASVKTMNRMALKFTESKVVNNGV
ncbi:MAG: hypothetical protein R2788_02200 [Saprospiraceae bacterium]